jgi:hypothetical protein
VFQRRRRLVEQQAVAVRGGEAQHLRAVAEVALNRPLLYRPIAA